MGGPSSSSGSSNTNVLVGGDKKIIAPTTDQDFKKSLDKSFLDRCIGLIQNLRKSDFVSNRDRIKIVGIFTFTQKVIEDAFGDSPELQEAVLGELEKVSDFLDEFGELDDRTLDRRLVPERLEMKFKGPVIAMLRALKAGDEDNIRPFARYTSKLLFRSVLDVDTEGSVDIEELVDAYDLDSLWFQVLASVKYNFTAKNLAPNLGSKVAKWKRNKFEEWANQNVWDVFEEIVEKEGGDPSEIKLGSIVPSVSEKVEEFWFEDLELFSEMYDALDQDHSIFDHKTDPVLNSLLDVYWEKFRCSVLESKRTFQIGYMMLGAHPKSGEENVSINLSELEKICINTGIKDAFEQAFTSQYKSDENVKSAYKNGLRAGESLLVIIAFEGSKVDPRKITEQGKDFYRSFLNRDGKIQPEDLTEAKEDVQTMITTIVNQYIPGKLQEKEDGVGRKFVLDTINNQLGFYVNLDSYKDVAANGISCAAKVAKQILNLHLTEAKNNESTYFDFDSDRPYIAPKGQAQRL